MIREANGAVVCGIRETSGSHGATRISILFSGNTLGALPGGGGSACDLGRFEPT